MSDANLSFGVGSGGSVTVTASALPSGAATEATLASLDGKTPPLRTGAVTAVAVNGAPVVRDPTKDTLFTYGDGTTQTIYYASSGQFAGCTARA